MPKRGLGWKQPEDDLLKSLYETYHQGRTTIAMVAKAVGRSIKSCQSRAHKLGITKKYALRG